MSPPAIVGYGHGRRNLILKIQVVPPGEETGTFLSNRFLVPISP
jgi:hypothetical protein